MITKFKIYEQWVTSTTNGEEPIYNREEDLNPESDLVKNIKNYISSNKIEDIKIFNGKISITFRDLKISFANSRISINDDWINIPKKDYNILYDYVLDIYYKTELEKKSKILDKIDPVKIDMKKFNI